jgi:hypothetical protein
VFAFSGFGYNQGWRVDKHIRVLADINNDGLLDIVGFFDDGVYAAVATAVGYSNPRRVIENAGYDQGWRVDKHVRVLADINNDGCADVVAFGDDGVWLSLADCRGGFGPFIFSIPNFGINQGWDTSKHLRIVDDINGDGCADIIAFGDDGVWTALATGSRCFADGSGFAEAHFVRAEFGYNQGWRVKPEPVSTTADRRSHPRQLVDIDRDGKKDIIGFGDDGVWMGRSTGDGGFEPAVYVFAAFGWWHWGNSPRWLSILTPTGTPTSSL